MRLRVRHTIYHSFEGGARHVTRILRLTPRSHEGQHVIQWRIDVDVDCVLKAGEDGFGNITHSFTAKGPVEALTITVAGEVDNFDAVGVVRGSAERMPIDLYLRQTPLTETDTALRAFARAADAAADTPLGRMHALQDTLHAAVRFESGAAAGRPAPEVLASETGDGWDFAHVMAAGARFIGIPARVTSGYYLCEDKARGIAHAWCEAWVERLGWVGFDAAHKVCPQESHLRLATGLDGLACGPVRGVGGVSSETLDLRAPFTLGWSQGQSQWQGPGGQGQSQGGQSQGQGGRVPTRG